MASQEATCAVDPILGKWTPPRRLILLGQGRHVFRRGAAPVKAHSSTSTALGRIGDPFCHGTLTVRAGKWPIAEIAFVLNAIFSILLQSKVVRRLMPHFLLAAGGSCSDRRFKWLHDQKRQGKDLSRSQVGPEWQRATAPRLTLPPRAALPQRPPALCFRRTPCSSGPRGVLCPSRRRRSSPTRGAAHFFVPCRASSGPLAAAHPGT